jgi:putative multiple sugar transport system permease protein
MKKIANLFKENLREYGILLALIAIIIFFQYMTDGILLRPINITNLFLQNSYVVIMALGMLLVIVAGGIDLSVGSVAAFIGAVAAVLMVKFDMHWIPTILLSLALGGLIGAYQGYWIAYAGIPSFIVTLAGMLMFRGLTLVMLQGEAVGPFVVPFQRLSSGFIPDFFNNDGLHLTSILIGVVISVVLVFMDIRGRRKQKQYGFEVSPVWVMILKNLIFVAAIMGLCILMASYKGLPTVLVIMFILIVLYSFISTQTTIGRRIYAMGGNLKAALLSGVNTSKLMFLTYISMGVLTALAGLIVAARLNVATPKAGNGFELDVIAAVYIGGASASGGIGTIIGAVVGAFMIGIINNGMSILGIGIDWQQAIKGLVLLLAVLFDVYSKRKRI